MRPPDWLTIGEGALSPDGETITYPLRANLRDLPEPVLVDPPDCACSGGAPQMREHTARWCSMLTTGELNALTPRAPDA